MIPHHALLAGIAAAWLAATPARADPAPVGPRVEVAVLRPAGDDPVLVEAGARLQLELGASGLTSALVDGADGYDARVALVREDGVVTIDILALPAAGAPLHRRVRVPAHEGGGDPAVIAVRAAELLRGIRLEVRRAPPPPAARAAAQEPDTEAVARPPEHANRRLEIGVGVLAARPFGAALGFGPAVAGAGAITPHVSFTAAFAGPFFAKRPATSDGSARTHEELGGIGLRVDTWRPTFNVHAAATVGLHHVSAVYDASGVPPQTPTTLHVFTAQSVWNPAVTLAAGASWRLSPRFGASVQVTAVLIEPPLELTVNGHSLATIGGPSLLPTVSGWTTF